ncbi:platelet glycoprotein 4-like [Ptychodera flava]|uniref:platelet glycoprotein 4-like n=1 Tax=Ptychodera flava TaxID=63121 RepID=UPI003969DCE2
MASGVVKLSVVGIIILALGIACIPTFHFVMHTIVSQKLTLSNTSFVYKTWANAANSSAHVYLQVWVWDLQNKHEVLNGAQPYLMEKGPYTYRESQVKHNITFNDNGTVSYAPVTKYVFIPEMSIGPESDTYTGLNAPLVIIANLLRTMPSLVQELGDIIAELTKDTNLFLTLSIRDIIWGYNDPIFELIYELTGTSLVPGPQFGILAGKNNTGWQTFSVFTGETDISKLNIINRWNGQIELTYWTTSYANMINGTDASLNPPFAGLNDPHYVYTAVVCRSLGAQYEKLSTVKGIRSNKFHIPERAFANISVEPDNVGFCTPDKHHCLPNGLLNISNCQHGSPAVLSFPHFLYADPSVILPGMRPTKDEHETFITIHQLTGVTMQAAKRMQINMHVKADKYFRQLSAVREVYFPMIWLNESFIIADKDANTFKSTVETPVMILQVVQYSLIGIGVLILIVAVISYIRKRSRTKVKRESPSKQQEGQRQSTSQGQEDQENEYTPLIN